MADQRHPERGYLLPEIVDPPRTSVCVPVPTDPNHKAAFLDALYQLSWAKNWQNDGTARGKDTSLVWKEIFYLVQQRLGSEECETQIPECRYYPASHPIISYAPNDPRYSPDLIPEGYTAPPWYFATSVSNAALGTEYGDVVNSIDRILGSLLPILNLFAEVPSATVSVNGIGKVTFYVRNVQLGSRVWVVADDVTLPAVIYDTNKDTVSLPSETGDTVIIEHEFETEGDHTLQVAVVSLVNDEIPFLFHGAAIIGVELCGFNDLLPGGDMDCCEDIINALERLEDYNERKENEERVSDYDETPGSINPNAPPDFFADNSEDRRTALCLAIWAYVVSQITNRTARDCTESAAIIAIILGGVGALFGPIGGIIGGLVGGVVGGLVCEDLTAWAQDQEAIEETVCRIYNALLNVPITQDSFESAFTSIVPGGSQIEEALASDAAKLENYLYFIDLLGEGYVQAVDGIIGNCACEPHVCEWDFRTSSYGVNFIKGSRIPGEGLANSEQQEDDLWDMQAELYPFPDLEVCGGSQIYYRLEATRTAPFTGLTPQIGLYRETGGLVVGGVLAGWSGYEVRTGEFTSGGSGPAEGWVLYVQNQGAENNFIIHSFALSDAPFT